jgi:hypothetical protein
MPLSNQEGYGYCQEDGGWQSSGQAIRQEFFGAQFMNNGLILIHLCEVYQIKCAGLFP